MPSANKKQHNLMAMVANNPAAAKRLGIPQKVGKEFMEADKGRKFAKGGEMKESKAMMKKEVGMKKMAKGGMAASKMGAVKTAAPSRDGVAIKGKTKGTMIKMAGGGYGKC